MIRIDDRNGVKWIVVTDENGQEVEWVPGRFGVLIAHEVEQLQARLAAAEARVTETTQQLALRLRAETCDKEELLAECLENREKLAAAEAEIQRLRMMVQPIGG